MAEGKGPALIESRYGPLGSGSQTLTIKDVSRAIDALALTDGRYVFRYYDGQDQRVVALEFDADFRSLGEVRAQFPEWIGDEEYYPQYCGH